MNHSFVNYSLAVEEIKLSHNLENLSNLRRDFDSTKSPEYLLKAINNLEQRLKSLREKKMGTVETAHSFCAG